MLAPLFLLLCAPFQEPSGVAASFRPGAETYWRFEQGGEELGHCLSRYEGEVALGSLRAHHFREQVQLETALPSGKVSMRFTSELWTDGGGHPLRFDFRAQVGEVASGVEGSLLEGQAELLVRQGPGVRRLKVPVAREAFLLANNFVSQLDLLLTLEPPGAEERRWTLFSANVLTSLPYTVKPAQDGHGFEDSLGERLTLEDGRLVRVEIPSQGIVMRREHGSAERFTIELVTRVPPKDLEHEEVTITAGEVSLAGTVTRPKGAAGRLPALFFLSGSGGQDRDGFSQGIDVGTHEILDRLTREGFLVLRVDDRGVGGSTGPTDGLTFLDLVEDGRRALRYLLARADVDPARVALIGHSEGGLSGPLLAASEPVAALVLMAAPGRPLEQLLREQLLFGRQLGGADAAGLAAFGRELDAFLGKLAADEALSAEGLPMELAAFLQALPWLRSHVGRDPLPPLRKVSCPILILQGGRDVQVSAERDAPLLVAALEAAGHRDHELLVFPELDHLFKRASGEGTSQLDYLRARPVDPAFLDALAAWLKARLQR